MSLYQICTNIHNWPHKTDENTHTNRDGTNGWVLSLSIAIHGEGSLVRNIYLTWEYLYYICKYVLPTKSSGCPKPLNLSSRPHQSPCNSAQIMASPVTGSQAPYTLGISAQSWLAVMLCHRYLNKGHKLWSLQPLTPQVDKPRGSDPWSHASYQQPYTHTHTCTAIESLTEENS